MNLVRLMLVGVVFLSGSLWIVGCKSCNDADLASTLAGLDENHDGIRDDVETFIDNEYGSNDLARKAMRQEAKALQLALTSKIDPKMIAAQIMKAAMCFRSVAPEVYLGSGGLAIEGVVVNTPARTRQYIKFNSSLSGLMLGGDDFDGKPCEF